jgi:hypothetical protein
MMPALILTRPLAGLCQTPPEEGGSNPLGDGCARTVVMVDFSMANESRGEHAHVAGIIPDPTTIARVFLLGKLPKKESWFDEGEENERECEDRTATV